MVKNFDTINTIYTLDVFPSLRTKPKMKTPGQML